MRDIWGIISTTSVWCCRRVYHHEVPRLGLGDFQEQWETLNPTYLDAAYKV